MIIRNTYFCSLFHYNKKLFCFVSGFGLLTLLANLTGKETTPFFVWAMYSEKEDSQNNYPIVQVKANDALVDYSSGYTNDNRSFLSSPLYYYTGVKQNTDPLKPFLIDKLGNVYPAIAGLAEKVYNDSLAFNKFQGWYARYIKQTTGREVSVLQIRTLSGYYDSIGRVTLKISTPDAR